MRPTSGDRRGAVAAGMGSTSTSRADHRCAAKESGYEGKLRSLARCWMRRTQTPAVAAVGVRAHAPHGVPRPSYDRHRRLLARLTTAVTPLSCPCAHRPERNRRRLSKPGNRAPTHRGPGAERSCRCVMVSWAGLVGVLTLPSALAGGRPGSGSLDLARARDGRRSTSPEAVRGFDEFESRNGEGWEVLWNGGTGYGRLLSGSTVAPVVTAFVRRRTSRT